MLMQNESHTVVYLAYTAWRGIRSYLSSAAGGHTCIVDKKTQNHKRIITHNVITMLQRYSSVCLQIEYSDISLSRSFAV